MLGWTRGNNMLEQTAHAKPSTTFASITRQREAMVGEIIFQDKIKLSQTFDFFSHFPYHLDDT